jgi:NAD(P)-dependent dehydrogenase (short-subunit alcohol dehydrogenase family)
MKLKGKAALVTGGAAGIGREISERFVSGGSEVLVADLVESDVGSFVRADVTNATDVAALVAYAERELGGLDVLVNNAGGYEEPVFPAAPVDHWSRTLDLNLRAVMLGISFALPALRRRGGGAIVNVASSAGLGLKPHPGPEYAAAKAAVMRLTACLAPLADEGIRINCVCPHTVATPSVLEEIERHRSEGREPPGPLGDTLLSPADVADAVLRFVRDERLAGRIEVLNGGEPPRLLPLE